MRARYRFLLAALGCLSAGGAGWAQTGHGAVPAGSAAGWTRHGPFLVCHDPNSSAGCVVETGVRIRAGSRVEVRARGKVNFGGGVSAGTAGAAASVLLGAPAPPPLGRLGDVVRDPDGEPGTDPTYPAPGLKKNSLLVLVAGAGTGYQPQGAKAGKFYQGGRSTSFTPGEDGELVLMTNDAQSADNRAVCEAGLCGWEATLDVYQPPAAGAPTPSAGPPPLPAATPVTNPSAGSQPAQVPPPVTAPGRAGPLVTPGPGASQPPLPPAAGGASHPDDVQGSKDHPLVPRPLGAVVRTYDLKRLDAYLLPLGPAAGSSFARSEKVRGQVTFLVYELAPDCSVIEAGEHYAAVLGRAGFQTLFACEDAQCGPDYGPYDGIRHHYWSPSYGERQITAVLRRGGGNAYASVHVQGDSPASGRAWVAVIEAVPGSAAPVAGGAGGGAAGSRVPATPVSGIGGGPGPQPGVASQGSPVSGIGAAAPQGSGTATQQQSPAAGVGSAGQGTQSPVSGVGAAAPQGSGLGTRGQQSPAAGVGSAGQGTQSPASGVGASAGSSPPALTPEQRQALDQCVNRKLLGAGQLPGALAATQALEARAACERELQLAGAAR